jgi:hypothetical protein
MVVRLPRRLYGSRGGCTAPEAVVRLPRRLYGSRGGCTAPEYGCTAHEENSLIESYPKYYKVLNGYTAPDINSLM